MNNFFHFIWLLFKKIYSALPKIYSKFPFLSWIYEHLAGSRTQKNWKISIFIFISVLGLYMTYIGYTLKYSSELNNFYQNAGVNIICGIFMYIFLDISFNSIEKKQGNLEIDFSYELLNSKIRDDVDEFKIITIFLRIFTPVSTIIPPPVSKDLEEFKSFMALINQEVESEKAKREINMRVFKEKISDLFRVNKNKKKGKAKIQILILDPTSPAAKLRHIEVRTSIDNQRKQTSIKYYVDTKKYWLEDIEIISEIINTLGGLIDIKLLCNKMMSNDSKNIFEVKLYDRIPPYSLFKVDNYVSFSFYPGNRTVQDAERWNFIEGIPIERYIMRTFNEIWEDDIRTCTLEQYMYISIVNSNMLSIDELEVFNVDIFDTDEFNYPNWDGKLCICIPKSERNLTAHNDVFRYLEIFENTTNAIEITYRGKLRRAIVGFVTHNTEQFNRNYNIDIDALLFKKYKRIPDTSGGYAHLLLI